MKKVLAQKLRDIFTPRNYLDLDVYEVMDALKDDIVRKTWLFQVLQEVKQTHMDVDKRLKEGQLFGIAELSARRKALQFVLEAALGAKREVQRAKGHNPPDETKFDLESVTVEPSPH